MSLSLALCLNANNYIKSVIFHNLGAHVYLVINQIGISDLTCLAIDLCIAFIELSHLSMNQSNCPELCNLSISRAIHQALVGSEKPTEFGQAAGYPHPFHHPPGHESHGGASKSTPLCPWRVTNTPPDSSALTSSLLL